jgi:hypothetical protein
MRPARRALLACALVAACAGCADPVHDNLVASLGPEDPNVPPGPLHRPGQPCLACHDGSGPAAMSMIFGGTAYEYFDQTAPLVAAKVLFTDATNLEYVTTTNCAGNFWVQTVDWSPTFPVHVQLLYGASSPQNMRTHIGRATSCATCHSGTESQSTTAHVYFDGDDTMMFPPSGCP